LKILLIEDNPGDARLVLELLRQTPGDHSLESVDRLALGIEHLSSAGADVVLLDLNLPDSIGNETVTKLRDRFPAMPIVVLTSTDDEELAVQAMRVGATDYLVKGQTDGRLIRRTLL